MRSVLKIIAAIFLFSPLFALAQSDQFIEWSAVNRLTWDDYLARPSSTSDAAAITSTALGVEYHLKNNSLTYTITCRFSKTASPIRTECYMTLLRLTSEHENPG